MLLMIAGYNVTSNAISSHIVYGMS